MAAREHYSAENLGEITVTSNSVWGSACTISPTLASAADYIVFWSLELGNTSNASSDAQCRVTAGGSVEASFNAESRVASEMAAYSGFFRVTGTGAPLALALEIKAETNGNNIVARNRRLTVLRMGGGDHFVESTARQAITVGGTTSWADVLTTSFTPDAGDYLLLGHSMTDNYATTTSVYGKFSFDGVAEGNAEVATAGHGEVGSGQKSLIPLNKNRIYTVESGGVSRNVVWQGRSHANGNEVGFAQNRLLILKLSDFAAHHSAWLEEISWIEGTSEPIPAFGVEATVSANPHLLIGASYSTNVSSTTSLVTSVLDDADDENDAATASARSYSTNDTRGQSTSVVALRTYVAGPRPIALTITAPSAEWVGVLASSSFVAIDLGGEDETSTPVTSTPDAGSVSLNGYAPSISAGSASSVTAGLGSLAISGQTPTVSAGQASSVTTGLGSLTTTGYAPTVTGGSAASVTPMAGSLIATGYAPSLSAGQSVVLTPEPGNLILTGLTPTISAAQSSASFPMTGGMTVNGLIPTVSVAEAVTIDVGMGSISLAGFAPSVGGGQSVAISPAPASLTITGEAPAARSGATLAPAAQALTIQGLVPTASAAQSMTVEIGSASISLTGQSPVASGEAANSPAATSLSLSSFSAQVAAGSTLQPSLTAPLALSGHAPAISIGARLQTLSASLLIGGLAVAVEAGGAVSVQPGFAALTINGQIPTVSAKADIDVAAGPVIAIAGQSPVASGAAKASPANDHLNVVGFAPTVTAEAASLPLPGSVALAPLTAGVSAAGMVVTSDVVAMNLTGLQAEVRITSGRPTLTRDRTYIVPPDQTICVVGRDQTTHVVNRDVTTFKAA